MICLECAHLDLRTHPKHAAVGLGQCNAQKLLGVFEAFTKERECRKFVAADAGIAQKRIEWRGSKSTKGEVK